LAVEAQINNYRAGRGLRGECFAGVSPGVSARGEGVV